MGSPSVAGVSAEKTSAPFGAYRGGRYTRAYMLMFWLMAAAALGIDLVSRGDVVLLVVLAVLAAIGAVVIVGVAQSVLTPDGLRLVLLRRWVPWTRVAAVVAPEPGDTELRLALRDGTLVTAKGVPPSVGPQVARLLPRG